MHPNSVLRDHVPESVLIICFHRCSVISFMCNIGEIDDSIYAYAGQPWVAVIYRITGSKAATIVMIVIVAINVCRA